MKITTIEKKLVALNNNFCWFKNGSGQAIQGKNQRKPDKARNSIKIKKLKKKWEKQKHRQVIETNKTIYKFSHT